MINPLLVNASVLAYLGDSYYEQQIRSYLVNSGLTKLNILHKEAVKYTSGKSQALIIKNILDNNLLSEEEINVYKRGRNISSSSKRNLDLQETHDSNGFESLIGYLSIKDENRAKELINIAINYIQGENGKN